MADPFDVHRLRPLRKCAANDRLHSHTTEAKRRLHEIRVALNYTQQQMADMLGITRQWLQILESASRPTCPPANIMAAAEEWLQSCPTLKPRSAVG